MLIYLILAAQFESYIDPLIIMFTVPLALAGAVLSLWIFGQTINIFSEIGVIVLDRDRYQKRDPDRGVRQSAESCRAEHSGCCN